MENTLQLRCPILTPMTATLPYVLGEGNEKYTDDPRYLLRLGLIVWVRWDSEEQYKAATASVAVQAIPPDDLLLRDGLFCLDDFGFRTSMGRVWVSPQAVRVLGIKAVLQELPERIRQRALLEELEERYAETVVTA